MSAIFKAQFDLKPLDADTIVQFLMLHPAYRNSPPSTDEVTLIRDIVAMTQPMTRLRPGDAKA